MELPVVSETGKFVVISDIELKKESMQEFKQWFVESNKTISKFDGFISRRLLESQDGKHRIMVVFSDRTSFASMHQTQQHTEVHSQAVRFMARPPVPSFYSVVAE